EVAKVTGVKPYVLRYWETEFRLVRPQKSRTGQRLYQRKDIEVLLQIKQLLYDEKYTISGAKKRLKLLRGPGERQLDLAFGAVAPDREQSATSHSISLDRPLRGRELRPRWVAVNGTPTDCVYLAVNHLLDRKPDLMLSGINKGGNIGDDVHYSGTVAAATEAA